jgi:tetratricopeptide (TPR) repeat protein
MLGRLRVELANLRAAIEFCLAEPARTDAGLRLASSLWAFWLGCGLQREGRRWLDELLAADSGSSPARVNALWVNGYLAAMDGDLAAALELADQCAGQARGLDDPTSVAHAMFVRGAAELFLDQVEAAVDHLETAVRLERELPGMNPILISSLHALGAASCYRMRLDRASEVLTEAHRLGEAAGDQLQTSWSFIFLGLLALLDKRPEDAVRLLNEVLVRNRSIGDVLGMSVAVEFLAWSSWATGDAVRAARMLGPSQDLAEPLGSHLAGFRGLREWHQDRFGQVRSELGAPAFERALDHGRHLTFDEAIALALNENTPTTKEEAAADHLPQQRPPRS